MRAFLNESRERARESLEAVCRSGNVKDKTVGCRFASPEPVFLHPMDRRRTEKQRTSVVLREKFILRLSEM